MSYLRSFSDAMHIDFFRFYNIDIFLFVCISFFSSKYCYLLNMHYFFNVTVMTCPDTNQKVIDEAISYDMELVGVVLVSIKLSDWVFSILVELKNFINACISYGTLETAIIINDTLLIILHTEQG